MNRLSLWFLALATSGSSLCVMASDIPHAEAEKLVAAGSIKSFQALDAIAVGIHPGAAVTDSELELKHGRHIYQVDLRDPQGVEFDLELDATSGEVLKDRRDD